LAWLSNPWILGLASQPNSYILGLAQQQKLMLLGLASQSNPQILGLAPQPDLVLLSRARQPDPMLLDLAGPGCLAGPNNIFIFIIFAFFFDQVNICFNSYGFYTHTQLNHIFFCHTFFKTCLFLYFKGIFSLKQYYIDALF